jgi:hypothetical protein
MLEGVNRNAASSSASITFQVINMRIKHFYLSLFRINRLMGRLLESYTFKIALAVATRPRNNGCRKIQQANYFAVKRIRINYLLWSYTVCVNGCGRVAFSWQGANVFDQVW